ncbi:hypothetical protein EST38_g5379 [Candolleomyces aberdarensis]|uniref:Inhibitor I9 domain-containing protein n=1 Tax=Candolleomyces aberdarensis TaxID=2316362 RepID=A0A4Q2DKP9_9AGAR|nr:hypothetical protein EST38_g5379 [Candolleomyces aberdarensis]
MNIVTSVDFADDNEDSTTVETKKYIIRLKDEVDLSDHVKNHQNKFHRAVEGSEKKNIFKVYQQFPPGFINAYAAELSLDVFKELNDCRDVSYINEDTEAILWRIVEQSNACWSLSRLQSRDPQANVADPEIVNNLNFRYVYDDERETGRDVDIYIVDTGVVDNNQFGHRVQPINPNDTNDEDGHGTFVAGIAAGTRWGVAKLVAGEVHVVVAAGNYDADASDFAPGSAADVITVGATDQDKVRITGVV